MKRLRMVSLEPEALEALDEVERIYDIFWDDGPWMNADGYLYYEASPREVAA